MEHVVDETHQSAAVSSSSSSSSQPKYLILIAYIAISEKTIIVRTNVCLIYPNQILCIEICSPEHGFGHCFVQARTHVGYFLRNLLQLKCNRSSVDQYFYKFSVVMRVSFVISEPGGEGDGQGGGGETESFYYRQDKVKMV